MADREHQTTEELIDISEKIAQNRRDLLTGDTTPQMKVTEAAEAVVASSTGVWAESHAYVSGKIFRRLGDGLKMIGMTINAVSNAELTAMTPGNHILEVVAWKGTYNARVLKGDEVWEEREVGSTNDVLELIGKYR